MITCFQSHFYVENNHSITATLIVLHNSKHPRTICLESFSAAFTLCGTISVLAHKLQVKKEQPVLSSLSHLALCSFSSVLALPCRAPCHVDDAPRLCEKRLTSAGVGMSIHWPRITPLQSAVSHIPTGIILFIAEKKIEDWLICLNHGGAGNTFHRIILTFLELMSALAGRLIKSYDLDREMKCQGK